jgi:hypothetical protein
MIVYVNYKQQYLFFSAEWKSEDCPRIVLNKLEKKGYKVVAVTGVGQTCIWTLNKPDESIS